MIKPYPHQLKFADKCWDILAKKGYVYLAGKPRAGKTLTSILVAEKSERAKRWLVLTKKAAISGWHKFTEAEELGLKHSYYVTNYEQLGKVATKGSKKVIQLKLLPTNFDGVIIDESHNLGGVGKPSGRHQVVKYFCKDLPHIHLSGTAIVESPNSIYYQMNISKFSPFKHKNFYDFFREYGEPYYIKIGAREINQYDRYQPKLLDKINEFTVYMTQEDAGIDKSLQAVDKEHYVELHKEVRDFYNQLQKDQIAEIEGGMFDANYTYEEYTLVCDTTMKLRTSLHMLESGIAKIDGEYIELGNTEKIDYIKGVFGDTDDVGIMCHFIGERRLLSKHFKNAQIYSSNAHAEGVDLSHLKHFIILSSDYSGSKFIQRRDRIINTNGSNTMIVNHILVRKAISEQVYKKVSKKEDFNNSTYEKVNL